MEYTTRMVRSVEGLTQEQALIGLQSNPQFVPGTRIASVYNQGGRWVAKLLEPKTAFDIGNIPLDFDQSDTTLTNDGQNLFKVDNKTGDKVPADRALPNQYSVGDLAHDVVTAPEDIAKGVGNAVKSIFGSTDLEIKDSESVEEVPAELHEEKHDEHEESESPLEELEEHEDEEHEDSEEKKIKELEKKIDLLLDALGISEKGKEPEVPETSEAPEGPAADMPAAPKGGPSKSDPLPPGSGAKLKPGEIPNKPGMTPVGAPAFASVKNGNASVGNDPVTNQGTSTSSGPSSGSCPKCGGPSEGCRCASQVPSASNDVTANTVASFTASKLDANRELTIRQAKLSIENELAQAGQKQNFRVARIKRDGDYIHALVTRNDS